MNPVGQQRVNMYMILCCCFFFLSGTAYIAVIVQPKKRDVKTGVMGTQCRQTLRVAVIVRIALVVQIRKNT